MTRTKKSARQIEYCHIACSFQGGGALGAYQAGVLHALNEVGYHPHWYVGTSIGAINAAIAAGNSDKERIEKMYQFWESIATPSAVNESTLLDDKISRKIQHLIAAHSALLLGQPGFFIPRFPSPDFGWHNSPDLLSYYDTSPLHNSLEKFIDFDRLNNNKLTRISVGAVEVSSGMMTYFDSYKQKIGPEHIMASGALPPGFPAVKVDGKYYWDGGISSNSPVNYILNHNNQKQMLCFMIHLFDSFGMVPTSMDEVLKRKKDIEFSSRFIKLINLHKEIHDLRNTIHILSNHISPEEKAKPEIRECIKKGRPSAISLVRFLYEHDETELSSKDYEFSKKSIHERIQKGYDDGKNAIKKSPWNQSVPMTEGIALYDMSAKDTMKKYQD
ncbi:TPA: patatin-like phospholipase family protein [Legionella pneumophila]|uniref:Esterase of the alpha-beta hydrolase superfamily n=1 Tax=Legionella pneumophila subsp. pneumophila TaxID=91891 RepID=A0AAV2UY91_LEGPN|nr:patatin-like phospholipase family protein [Legionella pneumophila]MCK1849058.1 patatin-like phospholipase family protein [Legionella pneumophila]MDI9850457.1 patatin-like phospholipase family protein [Legionella pneumophila]MDW8854057.1 patatin-like phospholipase family protein [Legionella pneumophila]MDW8867202.1 patatin-like phospholipase family protein [Legionella pneumophila]MDW8921397.1 patatin-like phospholipase family protein [Legionella pneumophila]